MASSVLARTTSAPIAALAGAAAVVLLATQLALALIGPSLDADILYIALMVAGATACLLRAAEIAEQRTAWALIGAGILSWTAGEAGFLLAEAGGRAAPLWTDVAYLGLYAFGASGVVILLRGHGRRTLDLTLEALVAVLGLATLWFWLIFSHFVTSHGHSPTEELIYPLLDLAVLIVAFSCISQNRWRPSPQLLAVGIAIGIAAVGDSIYAVQAIHSAGSTSPFVAVLWPTAALLLGLAAWLPAGAPTGRPRPLPFLVITTVATAIAVAALVWGNFVDVHQKPVLVALALLTLIAGVSRGVMLYLDRQRALARVRSEGMRSVRALAAAADARDRYTRDHSRRVAVYSTAIAVRLGLDIREIEALATAAELHDVGKIATPDAILLKPDRLTGDEYAVIKRHSEEGERILRAMGRTRIATWVRHHHERWDGRGYPNGLATTAIPRESRILAAADALDAMTTARSYSVAVSTEGAIAEIERCAGTQLDPEIAMCLVALLRERVVRPPEGDQPLRYELIPDAAGRLQAADYGRVLEILAALSAGDGRRTHEISLSVPNRDRVAPSARPLKRAQPRAGAPAPRQR